MDTVQWDNASKIRIETVAKIQNLLVGMDLSLEQANKSRPQYDRKTESRIRRSIRALVTIRREIDRALGG